MADDSSNRRFSEADLSQVLGELRVTRIVETWQKMGPFAGQDLLITDIEIFLIRRLRQIMENSQEKS